MLSEGTSMDWQLGSSSTDVAERPSARVDEHGRRDGGLSSDRGGWGGEGAALRMRLERNRRAPSLARAAVREFSERREVSAEAATLALLVSEVVSNAVLYSDAPAADGIVLNARVLEHGGVRIEVLDGGSGFEAVPLSPENGRCGGYGLYLVDEQASDWGVDREYGTRVWFELDG
jgi:anti-sigma regulatory factor (Ser/Thr protein kinase)